MDNFIVSARKYRPARFSSVVGQQSITSTLQNAIRNNTLAQAFLFCGPRGVGKTTCARIMAKTINCLNPTADLEACDECESCRAFNNNASFNIYELDAASNNSVEDIRNLVDQVRIPPQIGQYKVYIIDEVHMLSSQAFNAFLKTLEEPPAYAKFILATTEKHKIIPTILSRCQIFDFKRITVEDIAHHLSYVASSEGVTAEPEALNIIAQKADGALRDSLSIFDQMVSFSGKNITYKDVITNLNVLDYDYYFRIVDDILQVNTSDILMILNDVLNNGFEPQHFITGLGNHLRSLLVSKDPVTTQLLEVSEQLRQRYITQAQQCSAQFLIRALDLNDRCDLDYRASNNKRLHLEVCLLKMCSLNAAPQAAPAAPNPIMGGGNPPQTSTNPQSQNSQPQVAAPKPQVAVSSPSVTESRSQASVTASPAPEPKSQVQSPEPSGPVVTRRRGVSSTISINNTEHVVKTEEEEVSWTTPFSQEQLTSAWESFVTKYKTISPNFALSIGNYSPRIDEQGNIRFTIDNHIVKDDTDGMSELKAHLKQSLHNNQFQLIPEISEKPKEVEVYTDKDKFDKMAQQYPFMKKIQMELKLEGEL